MFDYENARIIRAELVIEKDAFDDSAISVAVEFQGIGWTERLSTPFTSIRFWDKAHTLHVSLLAQLMMSVVQVDSLEKLKGALVRIQRHRHGGIKRILHPMDDKLYLDMPTYWKTVRAYDRATL